MPPQTPAIIFCLRERWSGMRSTLYYARAALVEALPRRASRVSRRRARWRVLERKLGVAGLLDLDHERDSALRVAEGEGLVGVLPGHRIHDLEARVGTALDDAAPELSLRVGILEVHDGQGHPGITAGVRRLQRALPGADQEPIALAAHPDRHALGRAIRHQGGEMS